MLSHSGYHREVGGTSGVESTGPGIRVHPEVVLLGLDAVQRVRVRTEAVRLYRTVRGVMGGG